MTRVNTITQDPGAQFPNTSPVHRVCVRRSKTFAVSELESSSWDGASQCTDNWPHFGSNAEGNGVSYVGTFSYLMRPCSRLLFRPFSAGTPGFPSEVAEGSRSRPGPRVGPLSPSSALPEPGDLEQVPGPLWAFAAP